MNASTEPTMCPNEDCPHRAELAELRTLVQGGVAVLQAALAEQQYVDAR